MCCVRVGQFLKAMLQVFGGECGSQMCRMNGDCAMFRSYGVDADNCDETCRAALEAEISPAQTAFLRNLQLKHVEGDYLLVHAGLRPGCALEGQSAEDLIWIRQPFLDSSQDWGYTVVHGHTTVAESDIRENRIDIDTGAVWMGQLTAMAFHGACREVIQT